MASDDKPIYYEVAELAIARDELTQAARALRDSGAEYASYPAKQQGRPPRWVKFVGVNQLERAAAALAQQIQDLALVRSTVMDLAARLDAQQHEAQVHERRLKRMTRWDFIMMAVIGPDRVAARISERDDE